MGWVYGRRVHALTGFLREQLGVRGWKQADLVRESGLSRAHVSKLLADPRERLTRPPEAETVAGLARSLGVGEGVLWAVVLAALGVESVSVPVVVRGLDEVSDAELLGEMARRLKQRPTPT